MAENNKKRKVRGGAVKTNKNGVEFESAVEAEIPNDFEKDIDINKDER